SLFPISTGTGNFPQFLGAYRPVFAHFRLILPVQNEKREKLSPATFTIRSGRSFRVTGPTRPPSPRSPQRSGQVLRPYMSYVLQRWREGCTDSMQLWREIRALGYSQSARTVSRFITRLRRASEAGWAPETQTSPYTRPQGPSARAVSFTWV